MKRSQRYWVIVLALIVVAVAYEGWHKWQRWDAFERIVVWDSWTVNLPKGGSVTYTNKSPRMRPVFSPSDTTKTLIWQKPNGRVQEYPISNGGGGYSDIEFRVTPDDQKVWLIAWDRKQVEATLDLSREVFTDGSGTIYDQQGRQDMETMPRLPSWAKLHFGRSLGRKKF